MKKIELEGKPHLCLFSIKDINPGEEITYDYGGHDLPWRSCCQQELCKLVHEPVAAGSDDTSSKELVHEPVAAGSDDTSSKKLVHEPVASRSDDTSSKEVIMVRSQREARWPGSGDDERGRKRKREEKTIGMRRRETSKGCKTHKMKKEEMASLEKCSVCNGPFSPLKWWGLRCKVCSTTWHVYCFHKDKTQKTLEETDTSRDFDEEQDPEYIPDSESDDTDDDSTNTSLFVHPTTPVNTIEKSTEKSTSQDKTAISSGDSDEEQDPEYIPDSESDDTDDDSTNVSLFSDPTPVNTIEKSTSEDKTAIKSGDSDEKQDPEYIPDSESDETDDDSANLSLFVDPTTQVKTIEKSTEKSTSEDKTAISSGGQNVCFVCQKPVFKIARHFKTHIKEDSDIAKALSLPVRSKSRKELLETLRNRGNFMHNNQVLKNGSGSLKVKRKAKGDYKNYEYCIHCKGMFLRTELWRHMKRCSSKPGDSKHHGRKRVLGLAALVKSACSSTEDGVLKMLSHMHDDEISGIVRNDICVLRFAESLYSKHGHDVSKHDYIRQKTRQLGRLLQNLCSMSSIQSLEDAIKPSNFMEVVKAVKKTAGFDKHKNSFKIPSLALKIGHSLLKVSDIIRCQALMTGDEDLIKSSEGFQKLYSAKWSECISHCALDTISDLKYNKPDNLPLTEDIQKLHKYLDKSAVLATAALREEATVQNYSRLAHITLTKIVLFNRRRIGEVSKMKLSNFLERDLSNTHERMGLSEYEKKLCAYFERVELKGKRGRKVAVLLTPEMSTALRLMTEKRHECGVSDENVYLFAVPHCSTYYRGHQSLRRLAAECGAKKPKYLRSTPLRKEMATTCQILNLKDNELDQLADFLGHDISVHRHFYRLSNPTVQSGKISKLLLALEKGQLHELHGKSLDQIGDSTEEEEEEEDDSEDEETIPAENVLQEDAPAEINESLKRRKVKCTSEGPNPIRNVSQNNVSGRGKRTLKRPWTKTEVNAVMRHFRSHISKGHLASMKECESCKRCEHPVLQNRTAQNIRDFVRNRGLTLKRMEKLQVETL